MDWLKTRYHDIVTMLIMSALSLICIPAFSQTTKIKGRVTDIDSGEGLPFAAVFFQGTTIGVSTDIDGYFTLETRETPVSTLCASLLGYEEKSAEVNLGAFSTVDFKLKLISSSLNASFVKPDNRYMKWILNQIDKHKKYNDPERREDYQCDIYTKMELDVTNTDRLLKNKIIRRNFGFVEEYLDTSVISGQTYLPVMISETKSKKYHKVNPDINRETIEATRISGFDDENSLSQFTGSMHFKTNFYNNFIDAFNIQIPSPLAENGRLYYNYYLIDSLAIDGRKTWQIRFHPTKLTTSSVFDGEMFIDAEDFALNKIHVRLKKSANVNWIRALEIERTDQRIGDSVWFYRQNKIYADFSVTKNDSSNVVSFLGNRQIDYTNPSFGNEAAEAVKTSTPVMVKKGAGKKDEEWWNNARPYELSEKEHNIYKMVDSVKTVPLFNGISYTINTLFNGYIKTKYVELGPYAKFYSFNRLEGNRFLIGARTTKDLSRKFRVGGYVAYGTKDREFKWKGSVEWMLSNTPTRKLTFTGKKDMLQLGKGNEAFAESNIIVSLLTKKNSEKRSPVAEYSARYDWEIRPWLNTSTAVEVRRIFSNIFVPMRRIYNIEDENGQIIKDTVSVNSIGSNNIRFTARFSKDETVSRGTFNKTYIHSDYPVVTLDLTGSLKGIGKNEYTYFKSELNLDYKLKLPPLGRSDINLTFGKIIGTVPYPMLKLHEGNGTYIFDPSSFSCMEFYEFASDTWTTLFWEHNFGGFFLDKIPVLRNLKWRELLTVKAAYGTLSEKNNGIVGNKHSISAPMIFPEGMMSLNKPYVEIGVGLSNILKVLRVDSFWRLTHRYINMPDGSKKKSPNCFVVNIGMKLEF